VKKRDLNDDDGFRVHTTPRRNFANVLKRWENWKNKGKKKVSKDVGTGCFEIDIGVDNHIMDDNYNSDELDSDMDIDVIMVVIEGRNFQGSKLKICVRNLSSH